MKMRDQDLGIEKCVRRKVWSEKWKIEEGERIMKQERRRMKKEWRERKRNEREKQKLEEQERKKIDALERKNLLLTWMESERKKEVAGGWQPYQLIRRNMPKLVKEGRKSSGAKRRSKRGDVPIVDLTDCKYEVLRIVLRKNGWEEGGEEDKNCHLIWTDLSVGPEKLMSMKRGVKINHLYGMLAICRKKSLFRSLTTMRKLFPAQYKYFPRAFILPNQLQELLACFSSSKRRTFILKPDNGSQGRGVVLAQSVLDVRRAVDGYPGSNLLAQKYLTNPMLINGYKFDLRIYVLILSCDPLRLYLYSERINKGVVLALTTKMCVHTYGRRLQLSEEVDYVQTYTDVLLAIREGIVRFCTERYAKPVPENLTTSCMHLTNYALNKYNSNFNFNTSATETDRGHKWTLTSLFKALQTRGFDTNKLFNRISQIVVMTIIAIVPLLVHNYHTYVSEDDQGRSCFELLGMDVLIDQKCSPWLLEVNHSPSFSIDTPLDSQVKESLISDTLKLIRMDPYGVSKMRMQEKKGAKLRLYGKGETKGEKVKSEGPPPPPPKHHRHMLNSEDYEALNKGKYEKIYPAADRNLQDMYHTFLAGSQSAFRQSFDMKVKDNIAKVREDRLQEQMAKAEAAHKLALAKQEQQHRAQQRRARATIATNTIVQSNLTIDAPKDDGCHDFGGATLGITQPVLEGDEDRSECGSRDRIHLEELDGLLEERSKTIELQGESSCPSKLSSTTKDSNRVEKNEELGLKDRGDRVLDECSLDEVIDIGSKPQGGVLQMLERKEERVLESLVAQHYKCRLNKIDGNAGSWIDEKSGEDSRQQIATSKPNGSRLGDSRSSSSSTQATSRNVRVSTTCEIVPTREIRFTSPSSVPVPNSHAPITNRNCRLSSDPVNDSKCVALAPADIIELEPSTTDSKLPVIETLKCPKDASISSTRLCLSEPKHHDVFSMKRRYHGKLPELTVKAQNFFTIHGYTLRTPSKTQLRLSKLKCPSTPTTFRTKIRLQQLQREPTKWPQSNGGLTPSKDRAAGVLDALAPDRSQRLIEDGVLRYNMTDFVSSSLLQTGRGKAVAYYRKRG